MNDPEKKPMSCVLHSNCVTGERREPDDERDWPRIVTWSLLLLVGIAIWGVLIAWILGAVVAL